MSGMWVLGHLMIPCFEAHLSCSPIGVECHARIIFRYIIGSEYTPPSMKAAPITVCCTMLEEYGREERTCVYVCVGVCECVVVGMRRVESE